MSIERRPWHKDENTKLAALWPRTDLFVSDIARTLSRTPTSVQRHARAISLGLRPRDRSADWTDDEMEHLRRLVAVDKLSNKDIFAILPRTPFAIIAKIRDLGLSGARRNRDWEIGLARNEPHRMEVGPVDETATEEPVVAGPEPLWKAPPHTVWPAPVFSPARTCQYPLWGNTAPPRPAPYCGADSFRDSFCSEHWLRCHTPRTERAEAVE